MHARYEQAFERRTGLGLGRTGTVPRYQFSKATRFVLTIVTSAQFFEAGLIKALVLFLRLLVLPLKVLGTFLLRFKDIVP